MTDRKRTIGVAFALAAAVLVGCAPSSPSNSAVASGDTAASAAEPAVFQDTGDSWRPVFDLPLPPVEASSDEQVIAEGRYLFHAVGHCNSCHLPYGALVGIAADKMESVVPRGGHDWQMGPWVMVRSPNITPDLKSGIGTWTDRQLARAIQSGVGREGRALMLMNGMGYVAEQDLRALVSYLRTLPATESQIPRTQYSAEGRVAFSEKMQGFLQPRPVRPVPYVPRGGVSIERGAYLANGPARCVHCHSNLLDSPTIAIDGAPFAGSLWPEPDREDPQVEFNAPNLTPSAKSGHITSWPAEAFLARFRAGRAFRGSLMPWENFRLMTDDDLMSIYRYLKSLPPVDRDTGPSRRPVGWKPVPAR